MTSVAIYNNSAAPDATKFSTQKKILRTSDGTLWSVFTTGPTSSNQIARTWYSKDNGATWSLGATPLLNGSGSNSGYTTINFSAFIDVDDYLHVVFKDNSNSFLYYRRGTLNATKDDWTFSNAFTLASYSWADEPDIVAHKEGTGYALHCVFGFSQASGQTIAYYSRVGIDSSGAFTLQVNAQTLLSQPGAVSENVGYAKPTIDFYHTGDGKTVQGGTPHLFVANVCYQSGGGGGVLFTKATYSNGAWTWGASRSIDTNHRIYNTTRWLYCLFDGTRVIIGGYLNDAASGVDLMLYERDAADTTTTTHTLKTGTYGTANSFESGSMTYDNQGNVHFFGIGASPYPLNYVKWNRSDGSLSTISVLESATNNVCQVSTKRGYSNGKADIVYTTQIASPYWTVYNYVALNSPPNAPTPTAPANSSTINLAQAQTFSWNFSDPDPGDTQSEFDFQYRVAGTQTWTLVNQISTSTSYTVAANTFTANNYEWQVRTYDSQGTVGPWCSIQTFTAANAPATPTITDPANNATVGSSAAVTWNAPNQTQYQIQILDSNNAVTYDSGQVQNSTTRTVTLNFPTNNVTVKVQVRIFYNGLWSAWGQATYNVSYTVPDAFTVTVTAVDRMGIGYTHVLNISRSHPTPSAGAPTVTGDDIYVRVQGDTSDGERIVAAYPPAQGYQYLTPASGVVYEVRVKAIGNNGTYLYSSWVTAPAVNFEGILLHDPLDHDNSFTNCQYISQGATDDYQPENQLMQYQGREFPAVEFGDSSTRTVTASMIQSLNKEADKIRSLVERKTILCYRDGVGRKVYGVIGENSASDQFYGADTSVAITELDYSEAV